MFRILLALVAVVLLLAGCGPKPITRAELEAVIYQDGDLPAGWIAGQISDQMTGDVGNATLTVARELMAPDPVFTSEVGVAVYETADDARVAYTTILPGVTEDGSPYEVGEQGRERGNIVLFQRCRAVAVVRLTSETTELREIGAYARRLDERLTPLVC